MNAKIIASIGISAILIACGGGDDSGGAEDLSGTAGSEGSDGSSDGPGDLGAGSANAVEFAYVLSGSSVTRSSLLRVNLTSGEITTITSDLVGPEDIAISNDGMTAYVTEAGGEALSAVDLSDGSISALTTAVTAPQAVEVGPDGTIYVIDGDEDSAVSFLPSELSEVNPSTGQVTLINDSLDEPDDFDIAPDGASALVIAGSVGEEGGTDSEELYRLNLSSGQAELLTETGAVTDADLRIGLIGRLDVQIEVPGETALVTGFGTLQRIDLSTGSVTAVSLDSGTRTALDRRLRTSEPFDFAILPGGDLLLLYESLVRVDLETNEATDITGFVGSQADGFPGPAPIDLEILP